MAAITRAELRLVDLTPKVRRTDAAQSFESQETPILTITDSDGMTGTGYSYTIGTGGSSIAALLRDHLLPRLIGAEASNVERIWRELRQSVNALTVGPVAALALAAVDIALWDLRCKRAGVPLSQAAGGAIDCVAVYSTEGGWLHLPAEEIADDAVARQEAGFAGVKVKVGRPGQHEDYQRLSTVRNAVGPGWDIMIDANQAFRYDEAARRASCFRDLDLMWFEEPLPADDVTGHARLAESTAIPLAVGESIYSLGHFKEYLHHNACGVVQADAARIGGITPWLKVAHLAEAYDLPVAPHFLMEIHVALACAVPNCSRLEYIPQLEMITTSKVAIKDGKAYPSAVPGIGVAWDWEKIDALCTPVVTVNH